MQRIVDGPLGSGKSYYAVNYILKFVQYDKLYDTYVIPSHFLVISNLDKLRVPHLDLDEQIKKYGGLSGFFSVENFERIQQKMQVKHIVLVIDEAQKYFDVKYFDKTVMFFFEYSRHLGVDVLLLTQGVAKLSRGLLPLNEYIVSAVPRSKSLPKVFRYIYRDLKYNDLFTESIRHSQIVFNAYCSFSADEIVKPRNYYLSVLFKIGVALSVLFCFFLLFKYSFSPKGAAHASSKRASNVKISNFTPLGNNSSSRSSGSVSPSVQSVFPPSALSFKNHSAVASSLAPSRSYHDVYSWVDPRRGLVFSDSPSSIPSGVHSSHVLISETPSSFQ